MINILRMINKEKSLIEQELAKPEDERIVYFQNFFKKYKADTLSGAIETPPCDLAITAILQRAPALPVETVKQVIYGNRSLFENKDDESVAQLDTLVMKFVNEPTLYKKIKRMLETNEDYKISSLLKREGQLAIVVRHLLNEANIEPRDLFSLIELYSKNKEAFSETLAILDTLRDIAKEQEIHNFMIQVIGAEHGVKVKNKDREKEVKRIIDKDYNLDLLLDALVQASKACSQYELKRRERQKTLERNKKIYETLESDLYKAIQKGEVTNISSILKRVPNEEIRLAILKLVYTHNQEIYAKLSEEYEQLAANDSSHYQVLLAKYGISPETYDVGTVMENSIEELETMLSLLSKLKFTPPELLAIVQNSNIETIQNIQGLTEKGIITAELLRNHQSIFNPTSQEYEDFMRNLALINKKKLNPHYFTATEEAFVMPHQSLATSLKTLEDYDLVSNIKTGMNLSFLTEQDLPEAIDILLELGYEKNLEECLELLNYKDRFDRLKVLKALNIPITDTASLIEVLSTDKFYVADNEISNYIYNAVDFKLPRSIVPLDEPKKKISDHTKLTQFSNTSRTYSFNGVLISKNKVQRNLSHIATTGKQHERLIYGVMKGSTLTDEEVLKVVAALAPQKTTKVVKEKK